MVKYYIEDSDLSHLNINDNNPKDKPLPMSRGDSSGRTESKKRPLRDFGWVILLHINCICHHSQGP